MPKGGIDALAGRLAVGDGDRHLTLERVVAAQDQLSVDDADDGQLGWIAVRSIGKAQLAAVDGRVRSLAREDSDVSVVPVLLRDADGGAKINRLRPRPVLVTCRAKTEGSAGDAIAL